MSALHLLHKHVSLQGSKQVQTLTVISQARTILRSPGRPTFVISVSLSVSRTSVSSSSPCKHDSSWLTLHPQTGRPKRSSLPTRNSALTFLSLFALSSEKALSTPSFSFCGGSTSTSVMCQSRWVTDTHKVVLSGSGSMWGRELLVLHFKTTLPCLQVS